jgi:hypothetical protein
MKTFPSLNRLKLLEQEMKTDSSRRYRRNKWESILGSVGLMLIEPCFGYCEDTPQRVLSFAETGGESVHFGFLKTSQQISERSPVVLCVPVANYAKVIAEDLAEFLSIGCEHGWFDLEQLAYAYEETIRLYSDPERKRPLTWPQKNNVLEKIRETLGVSWRPLNSARLNCLSERYSSLLGTKR